MPKYTVTQFADMYRQAQPDMADLDDSDIMNIMAKKHPEDMGLVDKDDLSRTFKDLNRKRISKQARKEFKSMPGVSRFGASVEGGMLEAWRGIKSAFQHADIGGREQRIQQMKDKVSGISDPRERARKEGVMADVIKKYDLLDQEANESLGEMKAENAEFDTMIEGDLVATVGKFTGGALPYVAVPAGGGGVIASMATGAGIGALQGTDEDKRSRDALFGGLFGAGGALLGKLGVKAFNALRKKYANATSQQLQKLADFHKVRVSRGDISGKPGLSKAEVGMESKAGGTAPYRQAQSKEVDEALDVVEDQFAPKGERMEFSKIGKTMQKGGQKTLDQAKKTASKYYDDVEKLSGTNAIVPENSLKKLNSIEKEFLGDTPADDATVSWFKTMKENMSSGKRDFSSLRKTREQLGKEAKKYAVSDPNRRRLIRTLQDEVEKDLDNVIAGQKGKEIKELYKTARTHYKENVIPFRESSTLKSLMKEENPDQVFKKLIQEDQVDKARTLYKHMDADGKAAVEYGIVKTALKKAKVDTEFGDIYSPVKFANEIKKLEGQSKVFMSPEKQKYLQGVKKLMRVAKRAGQYMENPPTGNRELIAREARNAKLSLGILPLITQFEKFFSVGKGKNFILAASELDPNGKAMERLVKQILDKTPQTAATGVE